MANVKFFKSPKSEWEWYICYTSLERVSSGESNPYFEWFVIRLILSEFGSDQITFLQNM